LPCDHQDGGSPDRGQGIAHDGYEPEERVRADSGSCAWDAEEIVEQVSDRFRLQFLEGDGRHAFMLSRRLRKMKPILDEAQPVLGFPCPHCTGSLDEPEL